MEREYTETLPGRDTAGDEVIIRPELGGRLDEAVTAARLAITEAEQALRAAAAVIPPSSVRRSARLICF
jgi:hypothetical protein